MRAPPTRSPSKLPRRSRAHHPTPSSYEKQMAVLVVLLISATLSSFGAAYYLFTTRWEARAPPYVVGGSDAISRPQVVQFDFDSDFDPAPAASTLPSGDPGERYLAYLPHSGFHNQRIAFENALVLSRLLNRTLLVPPVRLGDLPIYYHPFDELRGAINNSSKSGLAFCKGLSSEDLYVASECRGYHDYTFVPWEWLVNLNEIKKEQKLLACWNLTDAWLEEQLFMKSEDVFYLRDTARNHYGFVDFAQSSTLLSRKYLEFLYIPSLESRSERLLFLGTLFGSSRLHLRKPGNYSFRKRIRQSMTFTNPALTAVADAIRVALGGQYLAAHIRLGDGLFLENAHGNVRLAWWKLVHGSLGLAVENVLALERAFYFGDTEPNLEDVVLAPPRIPADIPALRVPHPPLPPLLGNTSHELVCHGPLHTSPLLQVLNTPLFISTDALDPRTEPLLARFVQTFPCTVFLSDFGAYTAALDGLENGYDGLQLKPFLIPFLDAMIAARAWQVVGTEQSTFSAFVQDVLWRTYHGFEIVQRG